MIQRHSKRNDEQGESKKKAVSVPTNYQVVTLSDRLVVLIFSFKKRTLCAVVFGFFLEMFLALPTFNKSQDFLVAKEQCCLCTVFILVVVKVKDSCCATFSCAQTLLVPL